MRRKSVFIFGLAVLALFVAGCSFPGRQLPAPTPGLNPTQAYETALARVTELAGLASTPDEATETPKPTPTETPTASPTSGSGIATAVLAPSNTPGPTVTDRATCNQARAGSPIDVTIPDDTSIEPGAKFTKVWRLQNTGTCTWDQTYSIVRVSGVNLAGTDVVNLPGTVAPGQVVDISVEMQAPLQPGIYQSDWKLRSPDGILFTFGPGADVPFWVRIIVPGPTTTPTPGLTQTTTPTPSFTPTPDIHVSGQVILGLDDSFDLDSLASGKPDIVFLIDANQNHPITPIDNVLLGVYGGQLPSRQACETTALGSAPIAVEVLPLGSHLCFRTSEGRYGWLRLDAFDKDIPQITIQVLTWASQ